MSQRRSMSRRQFQLSGFNAEQKTGLSNQIASLNGIYHENEHFLSDSTHIICRQPSRSEKFLGGLATGKWLLTTNYIRDSYQHGRWLPEEDYEWSPKWKNSIPGQTDAISYLKAPAKWRKVIGETAQGPFSGWKCALLVDAAKKTVYRRLLRLGKAEVIDVQLPITHVEKTAQQLTHVFSDEKYVEDLQGIARCGVLCLKPLYIGAFLLLDVAPNPDEYRLAGGSAATRPKQFVITDVRSLKENLPSSAPSNTNSRTTRRSSCVNGTSTNHVTNVKVEQENVQVKTEQENARVPNGLGSTTSSRASRRSYGVSETVASAFYATTSNSKATHNSKQQASKQKSSTSNVSKTRRSTTAPESRKIKSELKSEQLPAEGSCAMESFTPIGRSGTPVNGGSKPGSSCSTPVVRLKTERKESSPATPTPTKSKKQNLTHAKGNSTPATTRRGKKKFDPSSNRSIFDFLTRTPRADQANNSSICSSPRSTPLKVPDCKGDAAEIRFSQGSKDSPQPIVIEPAVNEGPSLNLIPQAHSNELARIPIRCLDKSEVASQQRNEDVKPKLSWTPPRARKSNRLKDVKMTPEKYRKMLGKKPLGKTNPTVAKPEAAVAKTEPAVTKMVPSVASTSSAPRVCLTRIDEDDSVDSDDVVITKYIPSPLKKKSSSAESDAMERPAPSVSSRPASSVPSRSAAKVTSNVKASLIERYDTTSSNETVYTIQTKDGKTDPVKTDPVRTDPVRLDPVRLDPVRLDPVNTHPLKTDNLKTGPVKTDLLRADPAKVIPAIYDNLKTDPARTDSVNSGPVRADPVMTDPAIDDTGSEPCAMEIEYVVDYEDVGTVRKESSSTNKTKTVNGMSREPRGLKRKLDSAMVVSAMKKIKLSEVKSQGLFHMQGPSCPFAARFESETNVRLPLGNTMSSLVEAPMDENHVGVGVDQMLLILSTKHYPSPTVFRTLLSKGFLDTQSTTDTDKVYNCLHQVLLLHPPITPVLQEMYLDALQLQEGRDSLVGEPWDIFINSVGVLSGGEDKPLVIYSSIKLFKFLVAVMQRDFQHALASCCNNKLRKMIISRLIWPGGHTGVFNTRCQQLLRQFAEILQLNEEDLKPEWGVCKVELMGLLISVITMVGEVCYVAGRNNRPCLVEETPQNAIILAKELAFRLKDVQSLSMLEVALSSIQFPWMVITVIQTLLANFDNHLLKAGEDLCSTITLQKIVSQYMFLLPNGRDQTLSTSRMPSHNSSVCNTPKILSPMKNSRMPMTPSKQIVIATPLSSSQRKKVADVNKKNMKGETALHRACIQNKVAKVKELLATPGIDVNIQDNGGWSALHEAANHGHVQCVRELLDYKPANTIMSYFKTVEKGGVNLLAQAEGGITPLHDAIMNNHVEVAMLILEKGGEKLLEAKMQNGALPEEVAESNEMKDALHGFRMRNDRLATPGKLRNKLHFFSASQEQDDDINFSQLSQSSCFSSEPDFGPSDELYNEVLDQAHGAFSEEVCLRLLFLIQRMCEAYLNFYKLNLVASTLKYEDDLDCEGQMEIQGQAEILGQSAIQGQTEGQGQMEIQGQKEIQGQVEIRGQLETQSNESNNNKPTGRPSRTSRTCTNGVKSVNETNTELAFANFNKDNIQNVHVTRLLDDLKVCQKMKYHMQDFKSHLLKISGKPNLDFCKGQLLALDFLFRV